MTHDTPHSPPAPQRQPTILDVACGPVELTADFLVGAIAKCASSDWRAAAFVLTHDPRFREQFSDGGYERRTERKVCEVVVRGIEAANLPPDLHRIVLLHLAGRGLGVIEAGGSLDD